MWNVYVKPKPLEIGWRNLMVWVNCFDLAVDGAPMTISMMICMQLVPNKFQCADNNDGKSDTSPGLVRC